MNATCALRVRPARKLVTALAGLVICSFGYGFSQKAGAEADASREEFRYKVENLLGEVADVQIWRFTILGPEGKTLRFRYGAASLGSKGVRNLEDPASIRRLEVVLILRLAPVVTGYSRTPPIKLRVFLKMNRDKGGFMDTDYDVPKGASLSELVSLMVASGNHPVGKPFLVGKVNGAEVTIAAE